jgi:hypothetical protein
MARTKSGDETEAKNIKRAFDERIAEEYVLVFRDSRKKDGSPLGEDRVWDELADVIGVSDITRWRFATGVDGKGTRPLSLFDGRAERYRPGLDEVFRYIAATDLTVDAIGFPRGRIIVNRAMARALAGIRRIATDEDRTMTAVEVERLRFLGRWILRHMPRSGFSAETVREMLSEDTNRLMGDIDFSDQFILGLNRLYADWNPHRVKLLELVSYHWLRG